MLRALRVGALCVITLWGQMTVHALKLFLCNPDQPELVRTELITTNVDCGSRRAERRIAVRGKTTGVFERDAGTFQWSRAVQGLTELILRVAAHERNPGGARSPTLIGDHGSLAASFDYALGKPPVWIVEMFGSDSHGEPLARRFFRRSNPERKSPGPVVISLADGVRSEMTIEIELDGVPVSDEKVLIGLADTIESTAVMQTPIRMRRAKARDTVSPQDTPFNSSPIDEAPVRARAAHWLVEAFDEACRASLAWTDIFTITGAQSITRRLLEDPSLAPLGRKLPQILGCLTPPESSEERLGIGEFSARSVANAFAERPIRVALPMGLPGATEMFYSLKHRHGFPFEIEYHFSHAIEIRRKLERHEFSRPPDLIALGIAPALTMLNGPQRCEYVPLMFLPAFPHRVLAPQRAVHSGSATRAPSNSYIFLDLEPSTSRFYFSDLCRRNAIKARSTEVRHGDPDDIFRALADGDAGLRAIAYFPHYTLNQRLNGCELIDGDTNQIGMKEMILFAHEDFLWENAHDAGVPPSIRVRGRSAREAAQLPRARLLCSALRDSWLNLIYHPHLRHQVVNDLVLTEDYLHVLARVGGLKEMPLAES